MKNLFYLLFVLPLLFSCGDAKNEKDELKQPECKELDGFEVAYGEDYDLPKNYTGIVKFCRNGKVTSFTTFKDGLVNGLTRWWWNNGNIQYEAFEIDGLLDGICREWYENGQLANSANYENGIIVSEECWDEDGNKIKCAQPARIIEFED